MRRKVGSLARRLRASPLCIRFRSFCALNVTDVSGDFFSSLMMLCYCVLHVLRYSVHWNCCTEEMRSLLDLLEVEGSLARNRRFHLFNSWNLKEASHESFVFMNHAANLNVRICTKHCYFSGKRRFRCGEKLARLRDGCGRRRFAFVSARFARSM